MKPAPFEYYAPATVEEALPLLGEYGYEAKILAGGQSLIPMMNFRLAQPSVLIDINNLSELFYIRPGDSGVCIGAMTRHCQVERDTLVSERAALLYETMPKVATQQVRNRGTIGGSLAHADPAAELGAVSIAMDSRFRIRNQKGERWVNADDFFVGMYTTLLEPEELLVEIMFPSLPPRSGWSLVEVARRPHDFALVGVVAVVALDKNDRCTHVRLVLLSVGDRPMVAHQAMKTLLGQTPSSGVIRVAAETAAKEDIDPGSDIHASAEFRRHLADVLTRRSLEQAFERAKAN
ncbi:MAG: xanthine dehydrogenase family protein subunit M [Chloroflexota bacterium]